MRNLNRAGLWVAGGLLLASWLSACATTPAVVEPVGTVLAPGIYRVSDGARISPQELFDALDDARTVYIGETHDNAVHHQIQAQVLEGLMRRAPGRVALGMEMFQRPYQRHLDAYVSGEIDEAQMLEKTEYGDRWGFDFGLYRPLTSLVRSQGAPILALNASSELTKKIKEEGFEGLNEAEQALVPETVGAENPEHLEMFKEAMGGAHGGMGAEKLESFYRVQVTWDAVMGESVVRGMKARPEIAHVVVIAGMFHVRDGLGIPFHVEKLGGGKGLIVIPIEQDEGDPVYAEEVMGSGVGDYVWVE